MAPLRLTCFFVHLKICIPPFLVPNTHYDTSVRKNTFSISLQQVLYSILLDNIATVGKSGNLKLLTVN